MIRLEQADAVRYSDYNSYGSDDGVWMVGSDLLSLEKVRAQNHDLYSRVVVPEFQKEHGLPILANPGSFRVGGPQGTPLGIYTMIVERQPRLFGPDVYSVTSTTANLEWWTAPPLPLGFRVEKGGRRLDHGGSQLGWLRRI